MFRSVFWADTRWLQRLLKAMRRSAYNVMLVVACRNYCDCTVLTISS